MAAGSKKADGKGIYRQDRQDRQVDRRYSDQPAGLLCRPQADRKEDPVIDLQEIGVRCRMNI